MTYQVSTYPTGRAHTLFNDFDHLIKSVWGENSTHSQRVPAVDIVEHENGYRIEMDLPGFSESEINLSVENGILSISSPAPGDEAVKADKNGEKSKERYLLHERGRRSFSRSFALPKDASADQIEGAFKNGVLTVSVPRREETKPRSIEVRSE